MSPRVPVADAATFTDGDRQFVETDEGEVGVLCVDGVYYAVRNECPHRGGPVCTGKVAGALDGEWEGPGAHIQERYEDEPAITCPWHGWDFYLESGQHVGDDEFGVPVYDVVVADGTVWLEV